VVTRGKLSFHACVKFNRPRPNIKIVQPLRRAPQPVRPNLSTRFASMRLPVGWCVSLLFEANEARMPRLRNFDTKPRSSHCYEFRSDNRLESVANAHTAADLHVRPVS